MSNENILSKFYAAMTQSPQLSSQGPINSSAIRQDKKLALEKASSLLSYQNYLTQARSWKAAQKGVPLTFEHEVQAQASQALSDGQTLAAATLRATKHLKQAGRLDHMLNSWIDGVKAAGSVQINDLWNDLTNDPQARQLLKDEGLTEDLWTTLDENMKKLGGLLVLQDGKLVSEVKLAGQEQVQRAVLIHSASGAPQSLDGLLRRGQFERMVEQFDQSNGASLGLVASEPHDLEIADVILSGAFQSVQLLAQHKRKLEDTGLSTYAGNDPFIIVFAAGLLSVLIGGYLDTYYCNDGNDGWVCKLGKVLLFLGILAMIVGTVGLGVKFIISLNSLNVLNLGLH
ncbi:hypothetical protein KSD_59260 [Ktedonobacter sp. SOSP1-85]|uniref:hypothetical protein n=1 Tax=Ktedonobacter sp. SOSP1-85 TaxID=2778367 RepID=UPI0019167FAD|nr:hypothetical protein [Ktedonobacter sp. SOSP1-85]GHO78155.1 hypothetical protein KSD_59260 [Ktedonobacter sp. SOSP1-85]